MSVRMPIGVIGVITPWNFPIAIPSWKIAPALVAGNTVVFKPATDTPALGQRFVELLDEAGVPKGVVNIVHGGGGAVGERLVRHPDVPVITLTGSRETGVKVLEAAAERLKHVHLELGGKNAIIVMDDADLDLALDGILWSAFGTSGQRCTATSRVIVHESLYDTLAGRLVERAEALRLGPGWEDDTDVGPVINGAALEKIHSYTQIGKDDGATLLTGGEIADEGDLAKGFYYRPTIFGDVEPDMRIAQEEIFGPTLSLIRFRDEADAIRISNGIRYGLSSSIFTRDVNRAFRAMRDLEAGITYINAGTIGAEVHLPFGGHEGDRERPSRRRDRPRSTSSRSGSRSTSTTPGRCSARRSTTREPQGRRHDRVTRVKLVWFVPAEALERHARCGVRRGCRTDRRLRALLLVHGGDRDVPRRRRHRACSRREREGGARSGAAGRDRRPGTSPRGRRRRAPPRASLRGARIRRVRTGRRVMKAKLFTDGGSRGNPGPAAYGFVLEAEDGTVLDARGEGIGIATNNVAEYSALVAGLERAVEAGVDELEVVSDSELLVKQMRGEYRVKNKALQDLFLDASRVARKIHRVTYTAVRREHNELADSLVNEALDAAGQG